MVQYQADDEVDEEVIDAIRGGGEYQAFNLSKVKKKTKLVKLTLPKEKGTIENLMESFIAWYKDCGMTNTLQIAFYANGWTEEETAQFKERYNHKNGLTPMYCLKYPDKVPSNVDELEDDELADVLQGPTASSEQAGQAKGSTKGKGSTKKHSPKKGKKSAMVGADTPVSTSEEAPQPKVKKGSVLDKQSNTFCQDPTESKPKKRKADMTKEPDSPKKAKKDKKKKKKAKKDRASSLSGKGADDPGHASDPEVHGLTEGPEQDSQDESIQMEHQPQPSMEAQEAFEQYLMGMPYQSPLNARASVTAPAVTTAPIMQVFPRFLGSFLGRLRQVITKAVVVTVRATVVT